MKEDWKPGTLIYPLPAVLVSFGSTPEEYNILTVAWTGTLCTNPPMCYISVRPERHSYDIIRRNMEFVINLTTKDMARATDWCGVRSGRDYNKFEDPASPAYLSAYCRMQLSHTKTSMSFSAMLFGPFYFFYRKAWKPAFAFLAAELVLALPTFIDLLQVTDSSLAPGLSTSTLLTLSRVCSVLSFLLMIVRGLYGKWLYRQSAAEKIRRIRAEFPDAAQRKAVLCAQGGTSWAAVLGCLVLLMVIGSAFTLLLGPNVDALIHLVYG